MSGDSKDDRVSAEVPVDLKRQLRVEAAKQDKPMAELMREILHDWADEQGIEHDATAD